METPPKEATSDGKKKKRNKNKKKASSAAVVEEPEQRVAAVTSPPTAALLMRSRQENNLNHATEENHSNAQTEQEAVAMATPVVVLEKTKAQLKAERKAAFEAQRVASVAPSVDIGGGEKSKSRLKEERRALQEAQRAAKLGPPTAIVTAPTVTATKPISGVVVAVKKTVPNSIAPQVDKKKKIVRKLRLFSHLPQRNSDSNHHQGSNVHPAVVRIGLRMSRGLIRGSNSRCVATIAALKKVIEEYVTPPHKELSRDLDAALVPHIQFLDQCRPLSASMSNAIKRLRWEISQLGSCTSDSEAKKRLTDSMDRFVDEDLCLAGQSVSDCACKKISDGDVILTYSNSSLVRRVLLDAHSGGKKFRVIVVDSRPSLEGSHLLRDLTKMGINCTYVWINAVSYVMNEVTHVLLGCHSLLANGYVMSRVGSSQVALVARASNVPVLVCCETYKFCERVHTDAFVYNELGDPNDLVKPLLSDWQNISSLNLVNLTYDVIPAQLVTSIITELQMLPCTSVPVVLRVKQHNSHEL